MTTSVVEEGKVLSEALNTVKIQTQQMKRFLVSRIEMVLMLREALTPRRVGDRTAYGCSQECKHYASGAENLIAVSKAILRTMYVH
jgi:hypothetical protein